MTQIGEFVLCANCKRRWEQTFELEIPKLRDLLAQIEALYNAQKRDFCSELAIFRPLLNGCLVTKGLKIFNSAAVLVKCIFWLGSTITHTGATTPRNGKDKLV